MKDGFLTLHTTLAPEVLREKLKQWEPWGYRLDFDNGVPTRDCARLTLFAERPLDKFALFESAVPFAELGGGRLLDVGCNAGYNSIHAAVKYHFFTTGIDISPRHIEVGRFLASRARHPSSSWAAETFSRPREFDIILHFGTLYHLPNPLLSLSQSFENLKPGGYLALETQVYDHPRVEVLSARARSTAKVLYGRLSELYMDGALGLDPPRPLLRVWLRHSLGVRLDRGLEFPGGSPGFCWRWNGTCSCIHVPVDFPASSEAVLRLRYSLCNRSLAALVVIGSLSYGA